MKNLYPDTQNSNIFSGTTLQKKWKNIRDAYNKEYKKGKTAPSGSGARKGTQYMYFSRLSFLQKCVENKETTSNIVEEQSNEESREGNNEKSDFVNTVEIRPLTKRKRANTSSASEERLTKLIEHSIKSRDALHQELQEGITNQDEDKLFCLSVYKELKKFQKLSV